jgi:radical SAM protein with 4Fe4S-binding SPASM domain
MMRAGLGELAREARDLGLMPVTTTNGRHVDARRLKAFAQINVSHDGVRGGYERVRGHDGSGHAERAIGLLVEAGIRTGVNAVVTRANLDCLLDTAERVLALGASEFQLLRYKPAGRGALAYRERALTEQQLPQLAALIQAMSRLSGLSVRVDCALVPLLASGIPAACEDLERLGVFGCEAGRHLVGVDATGAWKPCSCWGQADPGEPDWIHGAAFSSIRQWHQRLAEPCRSCNWARVCRGGCQVVSLHVHGHLAPDPECPRVSRHRQSDLDRGAG